MKETQPKEKAWTILLLFESPKSKEFQTPNLEIDFSIESGAESNIINIPTWNEIKFSSKINTLKNNKQFSDSTSLNLNKLWKNTTLLPGSHSNNGTKQTLEQTIQTKFLISPI